MERRGFMSMLGAFFGALVFGGKITDVKAKARDKTQRDRLFELTISPYSATFLSIA